MHGKDVRSSMFKKPIAFLLLKCMHLAQIICPTVALSIDSHQDPQTYHSVSRERLHLRQYPYDGCDVLQNECLRMSEASKSESEQLWQTYDQAIGVRCLFMQDPAEFGFKSWEDDPLTKLDDIPELPNPEPWLLREVLHRQHCSRLCSPELVIIIFHLFAGFFHSSLAPTCRML